MVALADALRVGSADLLSLVCLFVCLSVCLDRREANR
jgi:hypothetical protein